MEQMEVEEPGQEEPTSDEEALLASYRRICSIGYKWQMVIFVSLVVLLAAGIYMIVKKSNTSSTESSNLFCNTTECSQIAAHIRSFVSSSANPCDDFYKFACGNFYKNFDTYNDSVISMHEKGWDSSLLSLVVDKQLNETKWKVTKNLKLARKFYNACMNVTAPHKKPDLPFLEAIDYITGGWPKKHAEMQNEIWWDVMLKSRNIGMNFDFFLNVNITQFPNPHFWISPPNVNQMMLFHDLWVPKHKGYIRKIVEYWGYNDASLFWEFEETGKFANTLFDTVVSGQFDVMKLNTTTLTKISDLIKTRDYDPDWLPFLQNITGVSDLKETELVYFKIRSDFGENYLSKLAKLIEATPTRHWMNYIIAFHIVREYQYLSRTVQIVVNKILNVEEDSSRHDFCIFETGKYFHADIEKVLVNQLVTPEKVNNIRNMYNHIIKALERHFKQAYASNDIVREGAIGQLQKIPLQIGGNDYFFNDKLFDETFGLKPDDLSDNAIDALHVLEKFRVDDMLSLIRRPSAFYNRSLNIEDINSTDTRNTVLPVRASFFQEPTYSLNRPEYINYGSLGTIFAYTLMSLYDDRIYKSMSAGKFPGWQAAMKENRENSLVCVNQSYIDYYQKQFNTSNIPSVEIDGSLLDYGSGNIAYLAYLDYVNASGTEQNIIGVSYDPYQVFWIMASTCHCIAPTLEESEDAWANYQPLRLPSYGVNGPKMNSLYFPQHFNCSLGTNMNPNKKCTPFP